jgi:hypothetical protein
MPIHPFFGRKVRVWRGPYRRHRVGEIADVSMSSWAILTLAVICAETDTAARLALSGELAMVRFLQGIRDRPLPSIEEALTQRYDARRGVAATCAA